MGVFTYGDDTIIIGDTQNIVLERLPIQQGDCEEFRLHRTVTYATTLDGAPFLYTVPPADQPDWVTDLASVPQLLTWLVPTSGKHLPAALVHDALVDDPAIDRYEADALFRDGIHAERIQLQPASLFVENTQHHPFAMPRSAAGGEALESMRKPRTRHEPRGGRRGRQAPQLHLY